MIQMQPVAPTPIYFCTLRLARSDSDLLIASVADLRRAVRETKALRPFQIEAIAVLPSVLHMLVTLPQDDPSPTSRIAMLKSRFSRSQKMPPDRPLSQVQRAEKGIWQRHTWLHRIEDAADFARHRDLIYLSPVHAGLCARPEDWQHTSLHRDRARDRTLPDKHEKRFDGPEPSRQFTLRNKTMSEKATTAAG